MWRLFTILAAMSALVFLLTLEQWMRGLNYSDAIFFACGGRFYRISMVDSRGVTVGWMNGWPRSEPWHWYSEPAADDGSTPQFPLYFQMKASEVSRFAGFEVVRGPASLVRNYKYDGPANLPVTIWTVSWNWVFLAFGILPLIWLILFARKLKHIARYRAEGRCPNCGHDLGATPKRCPECGLVIGMGDFKS